MYELLPALFDPDGAYSERVNDIGQPEGVYVDILSIDPAKMKIPSRFTPLPSAYLAPVGLIALQWGDIDLSLNAILEALFAVNGSSENISRTPFNKRKQRLNDEAKSLYESEEVVLKLLSQTLGEAAHCHHKRNAILHGEVSFRLSTQERTAQTWLTSENSGQTLTFTLRDLEVLFYRMSHVAGKLGLMLADRPLSPQISERDTQSLQALRGTVGRSRPIPNTP